MVLTLGPDGYGEGAPALRELYRGRNLGPAALSPDGRLIAFCRGNSPNLWEHDELWVLNRVTGRKKRLLDKAFKELRWSPDSTAIAGIYWVSTDKRYSATGFPLGYIVLPAAGGKELLRQEFPSDERVWACGWFPDSRQLFVERGSHNSKFLPGGAEYGGLIEVLNISVRESKLLPSKVAGRAVGMLDIRHKDGRMVATFEDGNIGTFKLGEAGVRMLTHNKAVNERHSWPVNIGPRWTPDGLHVAYRRGPVEGRRFALRTVSADGSADILVAEMRTCPTHVFWSRDSSALAWIDDAPPGSKAQAVPGVERPGSVGLPTPPGASPLQRCALYIATLSNPKPTSILNTNGWFNIAGWDAKRTLVCYSSGAIFEVLP